MRAIATLHDEGSPHRMLAELPTAGGVDRLYTLTGKAAFSFEIAATDPGVSRDAVREGRLVVIWSTVGLPPYVGYIQRIEEDPDKRTVEISGESMAAILYERQLPLDATYDTQAAGSVAMQMLRVANSVNPTTIWPGTRTEPGTPIRGTFEAGGDSLGNALDDLADRTGDEWWVEHTVTRGRIESYLRWGQQRGSDKSRAIHLQEGVHFSSAGYVRDALGYALSVAVIGGGADVADRTAAVRTLDRPSALVGKGTTIERGSPQHARSLALSPTLSREVVEMAPLDTDEGVLSDAAQRALEYPAMAAESFELTINTALDWPDIVPGDIVRVILHSAGFSGGVSRRVRILAMQPDEDAGEMDLAVKVQRDD